VRFGAIVALDRQQLETDVQLAAVLILQGYLDARSDGGATPS